ncbi:Hcp family type VI secretion system effector [Ferribacterium limneticum]|uniref:Hcp family type VI secretion system effector n=1 Tax=Ferribacterium limneticum TaxID=76259 RepID=UPI001CFB441F|nr:type VI secretion system tube protein Hcp [Ferribacterium limneticum]
MNTDSKPQRFLFSALAGVILLASSLPAIAANDYFLKFDGIDGSSVQKGHEKAIEFDSFNWGISIARPPIGSGGGAGKAVFSDFFWTQDPVDSSAGGLSTALWNGKSIATAVVDFTTQVGSGQSQTYFRLSFENVFITDLDFSASNDSFVNLAGSFAYDKVTLDYWSQDKTGKFVKTSTASYDLRDGTGSVPAVATLFAQGVAGPQATVVPEPESYAMFLAGLGLLGAVARRRRIRA